ncbi:HNH endonuclease signature motif containing protein [Knoellia aerolata]|uniref:HNH endonuclease n=1 Tax=Knoellia aerolata DSM 18566 TaxID=1385519 RepID=A0A0A0JS84_9MICO|nr:HNH endonuclease signature motif containing protein [Knoellia aerolata]KGN40325.1 HNH endonuclease [Knoellia aerolata DSM 18566]
MATEAAELSYAECLRRLHAAREAAAALPGVTWQATGAELAEGMEALGDLAAVGEGAEVALTVEAVERGEPANASPPLTARDWVAAHHRRYAVVGASRVAVVAQACRDPRHAILRDAVVSGRVSIGTARVALNEMRLLKPHLRPEAVDSVWAGLMTLGERHDARTVRQLREHLLATHGLEGDFDDSEDRARRGQSLSAGREVAPGLFEYLLRISREGRAALEAAIGPLSAPAPVDGEPDLRPHDQRRAEALLAVIGRAQAAGDRTWSSTKAQVFVTISLQDLQRRAGSGTLLGGLTTGELATPETVRRWACDATIIPTVLGSRGEVVDLGRAERWFTPAQIKRLWLRDRHCTYPGCDAPASWCDAHHLIHWADGGATDLDNAALLCQRHHTTVHSQRFHGWVATDDQGRSGVVWDRTRGAYDDALARLDSGLGRAAGDDAARHRR